MLSHVFDDDADSMMQPWDFFARNIVCKINADKLA
jgi:hypothetical protein